MVIPAMDLATAPFAASVAALTTATVLIVAAWWGKYRDRALVLKQLRELTPASTGNSSSAEIFRKHERAGFWLRAVARTPFVHGFGRMLEQAGLAWSAARLVRLMVQFGALGALCALPVTEGLPAIGAGFAVGFVLPWLYVHRKRVKRRNAIEEQLPEAIDLLSRAIRAGHAVSNGLRLVAEESTDPLRAEFQRVFEEQKYGMPFEESLLALTRRVDLVDVRVMVVAILIQREVGGNLAEILDKIAQIIRVRFTLRRQLRVYTAQGRMSGYVLGLLPLALAAILYLISPEYIRLLIDEPMGRAMLVVAACMQLVGYFWISRILKLDI